MQRSTARAWLRGYGLGQMLRLAFIWAWSVSAAPLSHSPERTGPMQQTRITRRFRQHFPWGTTGFITKPCVSASVYTGYPRRGRRINPTSPRTNSQKPGEPRASSSSASHRAAVSRRPPGKMMGSRLAAALLRRSRDQASALVTPRLPISPPTPAVPRVGSGNLAGVAGGHLLPARLGSVGRASSASRFASFGVFRSLAPKVRVSLLSSHLSPCAVPFPVSMSLFFRKCL